MLVTTAPRSRLLLAAATLFMCSSLASAAETSHYPNGTSGLKAATLPPPGLHYLMLNVLYQADELKDRNGDDIPIGFKVNNFFNVHRLFYVAKEKVMGATVGGNVSIPIAHVKTEFDAFGQQHETTTLADIFLEPLIMQWSSPHWDLGWNLGIAFPTGKRDKLNPTSPGRKDYWTLYPSLRGTYYFDQDRTWTLSVLGRYELHSKRKGMDLTAGDTMSFEWGLGKQMGFLDLGVSGYADWQVTDDKGDDAVDGDIHHRSFGIGPEVQYYSTSLNLGVQFRHWVEFGARDNSQGTITTLTFFKPIQFF